jgi:hypothetical protein
MAGLTVIPPPRVFVRALFGAAAGAADGVGPDTCSLSLALSSAKQAVPELEVLSVLHL